MSRVAVVSLLGVEESGVAVAALRYGDALHYAGVGADVLIASSVKDLAAEAITYAVYSQLIADLLAVGHERYSTCMWVGLHPNAEAFAEQLEAIASTSRSGCANIVIPERTGDASLAWYDQLAAIRGSVARLVFYNSVQAERWKSRERGVAGWRTSIVPPPVPDEYFRVGSERLGDCRRSDIVTFLYVGRMTYRKGVDRLLEVWPLLHTQLLAHDVECELLLVGNHFSENENIRQQLHAATQDATSRIVWEPDIRSELYRRLLNRDIVGVSLSRQEYDALALTEMLAAGLPVVASCNDGHRAIRRETTAIHLVRSESEFVSRCVDLATSSDALHATGGQGMADILRSRSMVSVGARLSELIQSL